MNYNTDLQFTDDELNKVFPILCQGDYHSFKVPFQLKGRGITPRGCFGDGWYSYMATIRAFRRLYNEHEIIKQGFKKSAERNWCRYDVLFPNSDEEEFELSMQGLRKTTFDENSLLRYKALIPIEE